MTLEEIARELVAGCREGREKDNLERLYAPDAVSVEAMEFAGQPRAQTGIDAIRAKHDWWEGAMETLEATVDGPFLHGDDRFAVIFGMKTRNRETGEESEGREVAVYHVADGRIVREAFFYGM